jgi:precorrin-6Y C5,15-methyltransferase (decarboxylating)
MTPMTATVTVVGVDGRSLPPGAGATLASARLVVGRRAEFDACLPPGARPRLIELDRSARIPVTTLDALAESVEAGEPAVVLVPGDPGFFGLLRRRPGRARRRAGRLAAHPGRARGLRRPG